MQHETKSTVVMLGQQSCLAISRLAQLTNKYQLRLYQNDVPSHTLAFPFDCILHVEVGSIVVAVADDEQLVRTDQGLVVGFNNCMKITTVTPNSRVSVLVLENSQAIHNTRLLSSTSAQSITSKSGVQRRLWELENVVKMEWWYLPGGYQEPRHYFRKGQIYLFSHGSEHILLNDEPLSESGVLLPAKTKLTLRNRSPHTTQLISVTFPLAPRDRAFVLSSNK